jgi:hypothetical protein
MESMGREVRIAECKIFPRFSSRCQVKVKEEGRRVL